MAVTILERPEGYILNTTATPLGVTDDGTGVAQFDTASPHGLTNGDIIYIETYIESYNGFFIVAVNSALQFYVTTISGAGVSPFIPFVQTLTIANGDFGRFYTSSLTHGWSCVHLPITYRLSNDLYPTNSADTTRNINSVQEANGYTVILISGSLGSGVNSYDFVKITVPNDTELSGVYQILEFISPTVMIINLLYDSGNNFTSATALKHYNNYNIQVRVYAGINASHEWTAQKPYELAATLVYIPDENNEVFFSINELLKSYIETRNNLVLGTLPNNIDFWTNFYIETAESYDDSDGYTFGTNQGNFTSDQSTFEGTAVNAKLEFKNLQSGYLSEYLMINSAAKFLTLFTIPVIFSCGDDTPDCYSDISFLNPYDDIEIIVKKDFYSDGNGPVTENTSLGIQDSGVIRVQLDADCDYDRVDVTIKYGDEFHFLYDFDLDIVAQAFTTRTGLGDFYGISPNGLGWTQTENLSYGGFTFPNGCWRYDGSDLMFGSLSNTVPSSEVLSQKFSPKTGNLFIDIVSDTWTLNYNDTLQITVTYNILASGVIIATQTQVINSDGVTPDTGNLTGTLSFGAVVNADEIQISIAKTSGAATTWSFLDLDITLLDLYSTDTILSETKQFKINCGCCPYEIRLSWLNNVGGMEPTWAFCGKKDDIIEIQEAMTTKKNILPTWPKSYGADADTIKKQTKRISNKAYTVRSQFLTADEADAIAYIKSSLLVQIINSRTDRRTVLVDTDSFVKRKDGDKTFEIAFNISFTDDIPVQTL